MIGPRDIPLHHLVSFALGVKLAQDAPRPAYNLSGMLYVAQHKGEDWGLLSVPNALVRGVFSAMSEPGVELPPGHPQLDAHVTVFRPDEIAMIGGPEKLVNDRGKRFNYTIGRLIELEPEGWAGMAKAFVLRIHSPQLQVLRRSYGLSGLPDNGTKDFHVTVAVLRRGVLGRNDTAKGAA
jgi:hypothetical protein